MTDCEVVPRCVKVPVPSDFVAGLETLSQKCIETAKTMLKHRDMISSKHWKDVPCVVAKGLSAKYQRNPKCKAIKNIVIPVCGDKGMQVKLEGDGIRVPALFKKQVLPVRFPHPVDGFIRSVEFFKRNGQWFASVCYNTKVKGKPVIEGVIGVDRNCVGNIAVMADPQNGKVRKLGFDPANTKKVFRNRRKNLQKQEEFRLLEKIKHRQSNRIKHENHRASKTIVEYAVSHRRAIVLEDLSQVRKPGSKIKRYIERNQWAYAQLETFIRYKAALHGIPVISVNPAYTSKACSRCGHIQDVSGKKYECKNCGHNEHRDANGAFNIGARGVPLLSGACLSVHAPRLTDDPLGKDASQCVA